MHGLICDCTSGWSAHFFFSVQRGLMHFSASLLLSIIIIITPGILHVYMQFIIIKLVFFLQVICLQSLLVTGSLFAFCNLQIHKTISSSVVEAFATDKTLFLQYPTSDYLSVPLVKMRLPQVRVNCYSIYII